MTMSDEKRRNLRDVLDDLDRYFEDFEKEIEEAVRNSIDSVRAKPFMAGFSFQVGPEGKPVVQLFGDNPLRNGGYRSPLVEQMVDDKAGLLRIVLDMPGVEKSDIKVDAKEETAVVTAEAGGRKYRADVSLKQPVQPDSGKAEYRNGVLEISFSIRDNSNKGFKRVNIV